MDSVLFLVGLDLTNEYLGKELLVDFVFLGTVKLRERFCATEHLMRTEMQKAADMAEYISLLFSQDSANFWTV